MQRTILFITLAATATGRNPWPSLVLTLAAGSFGPLVYLLTQPLDKSGA